MCLALQGSGLQSAAHTGLSVSPLCTVSPPNSLTGRLESKMLRLKGQKLKDGTGALFPSPRPDLSQGEVSCLRLLNPYVDVPSGSWFRDLAIPMLGPPRKSVSS